MTMRHPAPFSRLARAFALGLALAAIVSASFFAKGTMLSQDAFGFELCTPEGVASPESGHLGELCAFALHHSFVAADLPSFAKLASPAVFQSAFLSQQGRALVALAQKRPTFAQGPPTLV